MSSPVQGSGKRATRRWMAALLGGIPLVLLCLGASTQQAQAGSEPSAAGESVIDCTLPDSPAELPSGKEWLKLSLLAQHCINFEAIAVRAGTGGVRTLVLSHQIVDGEEHDRLVMLDGAPSTHQRSGVAATFLDNGDVPVPASPGAIAGHLEDLYQFRVTGNQRIAGREAVRVDIQPRDNFRYARRHWLDLETALPLKQELLGEQGVLETFQLVELDAGQRYTGTIPVEPSSVEPPGSGAPDAVVAADTTEQSVSVGQWQTGWMPPGFVSQPGRQESAPGKFHQLYSDGLTTLSLFVEPLHGQPNLKPGTHRLGVSQAAVLQRRIGEQVYQVMAIGELPPHALQRVASNIQPADDRPADKAVEADKQ